MANLLTNLKQLSNTPGVSGDEGAVRRLILAALRDHVDEARVDTLGNVLAVKRARGRAKLRVMLDAHMDEIGLMIFGANSDGTLRFRAVGGIDDRILPGKAVRVGPDQIPGVIGMPPVHLGRSTDTTKIEDLAIDIGAASEEEAKRAVSVGQMAVFDTEFRTWNGAASGKALDDRAGCAVLLEILHGERLPVDILAAFTVQEEVGLRGAKVAAHTFDPDAAVAIDTTPANDLPSVIEQDVSPNTQLGHGPAIYVMTRRDLSDPRLVKHFIATGDALKIPYQIRQPGGGGTNAGGIIPARSGVPTISVSVPARYLHSPASLIYLSDVRRTIELVRESVARLTPEVLHRP